MLILQKSLCLFTSHLSHPKRLEIVLLYNKTIDRIHQIHTMTTFSRHILLRNAMTLSVHIKISKTLILTLASAHRVIDSLAPCSSDLVKAPREMQDSLHDLPRYIISSLYMSMTDLSDIQGSI